MIRMPRGLLLVLAGRGSAQEARQLELRLREAIRRKPIELVGAGGVAERPEDIRKAVEQAQGCDFIIATPFRCLGYEEEYAAELAKAGLPTLIWSLEEPGALSMPSAIRIAGMLRRSRLLHGRLDERTLIQVNAFARAAAAARALRCRVLVVGDAEPPEGMEPVKMDLGELEELMNKVGNAEVSEVMEAKLRGAGVTLRGPPAAISRQVRLAIALRRAALERRASCVLLGCRELMKRLGEPPCLAASLLAEELIVECSGSPSRLAATILAAVLSGKPPFRGFLAAIEIHDRVARVISCGAAPLSLALDPRDIEIIPQPSWWAKGVSVRFAVKQSRVTLLSASLDEGGRMRIVAAAGTSFIAPRERFREDVEEWPHAFVKLDAKPQRLLDALMTPDLVVALGDHRRAVAEFARIVGAECEIIE